MKNELLLLIRKHTDTLIEQTKTKAKETHECKMKKQKMTFSFNPPINLVEEKKCMIGVTRFQATNSVFIITDKNNSFSTTVPGYWTSRGGSEKFTELRELLQLREKMILNCM